MQKIIELHNIVRSHELPIVICGVKINNVSMIEALSIIEVMIMKRKPAFVVTPNVDHIVRLQKDKEFKSIYNNASLILPDGVPILWAAKYLKSPLKEKVSGSDLFLKLLELSAKKGYKIYILGGKVGAAKKVIETAFKNYPTIKIVGIYCPNYGFESNVDENKKIIQEIKESKADILFVGLGSPKQEKWIYDFKNQYDVPVSIGIGASIDFYAGVLKRAPKWMQQIGLEWFWRLSMEPARLWKRYLIQDPLFFWLVLRQGIGKYER
ncbi:MAG: WecB/TagA/CpsF family glycosyltransferase [Dehalococcoidales bacterium]|jgi:N-acetylglucosaminyldiphosphoundecaprenol N-acetyl-beta-D-mannosaminyltransferase